LSELLTKPLAFARACLFFGLPGREEQEKVESSHEVMRVTRSASFDLGAPMDDVFPLFGPERERDWAWGWQPEPVDPPQINAEEGAVFKTTHNGDETVWVISRYDPANGRVEYVTFRHDDRLGQISIQVSAMANGSHVEVTYAFTALSEKGERHIAHFTEDYYRKMIGDWQRAISHFLETGETLQP
jgi:hypothetical protein